jgi:hypothetical protein
MCPRPGLDERVQTTGDGSAVRVAPPSTSDVQCIALIPNALMLCKTVFVALDIYWQCTVQEITKLINSNNEEQAASSANASGGRLTVVRSPSDPT